MKAKSRAPQLQKNNAQRQGGRLCVSGSHVRIQLDVPELPHLLLRERVQHIVLRPHTPLQRLHNSGRLQSAGPNVQVQNVDQAGAAGMKVPTVTRDVL